MVKEDKIRQFILLNKAQLSATRAVYKQLHKMCQAVSNKKA